MKRRCVGAWLVVVSIAVGSQPVAQGQTDPSNDYNGIRVCTPDEVRYIETLNDPEESPSADSTSSGMPEGEGGDWLQEGSPQYVVAKEIYDFWTKKIGTSGAFAAGVVANVKQESNFVPNISEGGGRFPQPMATTPTHGGPGGGLYQFTPYEKYVSSPHFAAGGWIVAPQSQFVWDSEFITGSVDAGMKNAPNLYGIEAPFTRAYTALPQDRQGTPRVILDPNALVTTDDPAKASKGFQVGYERPGQYHPEREQDAIAANKAFNKNNYRGDSQKLSQAVPRTAVAQGALNAVDTLGQYATGSLTPDESKRSMVDLFASPCLLDKDGRIILNKQDAADYAAMLCTGHGSIESVSSRSGRSGSSGSGGGAYERMANKDKFVPDARKLAQDISREFPEIETIGGWRPVDAFPDHPSGRALDVMIPDYSSAKGKALGDEIKNFVHDNADKYNVEYTIWRQKSQNVGGAEMPMEDRGGDTANHYDHVHITVHGSGSGGGNNSDTSTAQRARSNSSTALSMECGGRSGGAPGGSIKPNPDGAAIPAEGTISSLFGENRPEGGHSGLDIANALGTPIYAVADGIVINAEPASGYGLWIRIRHEDGTISEYGHQTKNHVKVGDTVKAGDHIADMGSQGYSTGSHLHLTMYDTDGTTKIDPADWLNANGIAIKKEIGFQVTKDLAA